MGGLYCYSSATPQLRLSLRGDAPRHSRSQLGVVQVLTLGWNCNGKRLASGQHATMHAPHSVNPNPSVVLPSDGTATANGLHQVSISPWMPLALKTLVHQTLIPRIEVQRQMASVKSAANH